MTTRVPEGFPRGEDIFDDGEVIEPPARVSPLVELGVTGIKRTGGYIDEEFLPALRGRKAIRVFREMSHNDSMVGALLFAIDKLVREVDWKVIPSDHSDENSGAAEFLESCRDDMSHSWDDFISEVLSMLVFGWSWHEIVYKKRVGPWEKDPRRRSKHNDGRIGWRKMPIRAQETLLRWGFDEAGGVKSMVQMAPPRYQTVVLPIERSLLFRTSISKGNPEGISLLRTAYRCVDETTEILTAKGWVLAGKVSQGEEIYTLNPTSHEIEIEPVQAMNVYHHAGQMIRAESDQVDQLVTPNHRMYVRMPGEADYGFMEAQLCPITAEFLTTGTNEVSDASSIKIGTDEVEVSAWAPVLGRWLAGGEAPDAAEHLAGYGVGITRRCPEYVFTWSRNEIRALLGGYQELRGTTYTDPRIREERDAPAQPGYHTYSPELADDLSRLLFLCGLHPEVRISLATRDSRTPLYIVTGTETGLPVYATWSVEDYDGYVYCPTTGNGVIYIRRNGKSSWTGNSWYLKKRIEEFEAIGVERDLAGMPVGKVPADYLNAKPGTPQHKTVEAFRKMVRGVRRDENEGLILPVAFDRDTKQPLFDFELMSSGGARQFDTDRIVQRYEQRILMSVLADFILVGHQQVGSYALHTDKTGIFRAALNAITKAVADVLNRHAVPRLFSVNGWKLDELPKFEPTNIDPPDLNQLASFISATAGAGMQWFPDPELEKFVRDIARLPEMTGEAEEYKRQMFAQQQAMEFAGTQMEMLGMQQKAELAAQGYSPEQAQMMAQQPTREMSAEMGYDEMETEAGRLAHPVGQQQAKAEEAQAKESSAMERKRMDEEIKDHQHKRRMEARKPQGRQLPPGRGKK